MFPFSYKPGSPKDLARSQRGKGGSKVFKLKPSSRLPAQSVLFSVTQNKLQMIHLIMADLIEHHDDPVEHKLVLTGPDSIPVEIPGSNGSPILRHDLTTNQEEADTNILHQVFSFIYIMIYAANTIL